MTSQSFQNESPTSLATPEPRSTHQQFRQRQAVAIHLPLLSPWRDIGWPSWRGLGTDTILGLLPGGGQLQEGGEPHEEAPSTGGTWILCFPYRSPPTEVWLAQNSGPPARLGTPSPAACLSSSLRASCSTSHWRSGLKPGSLHESLHRAEVV